MFRSGMIRERIDEIDTNLNKEFQYSKHIEEEMQLLIAIKKSLTEDKQKLLLELVDCATESSVISERVMYKEGFLDGFRFCQELININ